MHPPHPSSRAETQDELARAMLDFVAQIPASAELEWTKDLGFLTDFEAERLLTMRQALQDSGFTEESSFDVLDFGYLHGVIPEFIHRAFPKARFTVCDWPGNPLFQNDEYLKLIRSRTYLKVIPLDVNKVEELPAHFQVIILGEIIEHLDPTVVASVLGKLRDRVTDGGTLLITSPNGGGIYNALSAMSNHEVVHPPIPDKTMGYGHIHLWTVPVLHKTLAWTGWAQTHLYFTHGRETTLFRQSRSKWGSLKYQLFIKSVELLANLRPALRGFFVLAAQPAAKSIQNTTLS